MAALAYISKGGFTYDGIMEMVPADRRFYLRKLTEWKEKEADALKRASKSGSSPRKGRK